MSIAEHPRDPPVWLEHWPAEADMRTLFPAGIRRVAYRFMGQESRRTLTWSADRLVLSIGRQQATWRLRGTSWQRSCSCGYVNDGCLHAYVAACLLNEIIRQEKWDQPTRDVASRPPTRAPEDADGAARHTSEAPETPPATGTAHGQPSKLEVEADFHHEPGRVTIRVYACVNDRREILRLQRLANLTQQAARSGPSQTQWKQDDWRFLKWLAPHFHTRSGVRTNLQVLKLSPAEFNHWVEHWQSVPGRFIERQTQEPVQAKGTGPSHVVFELRDEGEWIRIAAVVVLSSGRKRPFHELFRQLAAGGGEGVAGGELTQVTPPVSWDLLRRVFSRRDPRMRREHICEHLPGLLEGRLDVIEGTCVEHREHCATDVSIEASADGADIVLRTCVGDVPVPREGAIPTGMTEAEEVFLISSSGGPAIEAVRTLFAVVEAQEEDRGCMRVRGTPQRMQALRQAWMRLPQSVTRSMAPELRGLLQDGTDVRAHVTVREERNFVDLTLHWDCGGVRVRDQAVREALRGGGSVFRSQDGPWLAMDPERVQEVYGRIGMEHLDAGAPLRLFRAEAGERLKQLRASATTADLTPACHSLGERLIREAAVAELTVPAGLSGVLRHYQEAGFAFLVDRMAHGVGAILADDMGLGKTLQVLAAIRAWLDQRQTSDERFRTLVVCPASVVAVWIEQAAAFTPSLRCRTVVGPSEVRARILASDDWDIAVTNYALLRIDAEAYSSMHFGMVVLDEAQNIKNPGAQVTQVAKALRTDRTLALTGTPLENRLLDLWSIMDFLNPGFLGSAEDFSERFGGQTQRTELAKRISPVILRRTKDAVAPELPPRTEEIIHVDMTPEQRRIYDRELVQARETVRTQGPIEMLAALTRLRQICCDPALLGREDSLADSAKLETLTEMVTELAEEGHFALVFSQFTTMLDRIRPVLEAAGVNTMTITGQTPTAKRADLVRQFSEASEPTVFLLSLRAAGTGLTLTRADYVFIFDPWWNPAVERQAIDRTHRIGQEKPVFAYRLVAADSVEEKVLKLQQEKGELFAEVMGDAEKSSIAERLTSEDIRALLA